MFAGMSERARRPGPFAKPGHWTDRPPPHPAPARREHEQLSPTRYGDWVKDGIAVDF
jgi:hypothetical protein